MKRRRKGAELFGALDRLLGASRAARGEIDAWLELAGEAERRLRSTSDDARRSGELERQQTAERAARERLRRAAAQTTTREERRPPIVAVVTASRTITDEGEER